MKGLLSLEVVVVLASVLALHTSPSEAGVVFTSLAPDKCWEPAKQIIAAYDEQGLEVVECKAPTGWQVYVVVAGDRSWLDFKSRDHTWTTEDEVAYGQQTRIGNFPNVGEGVMEWGVTPSKHSSYAIFRVNAQNARKEASVGDVVSRLFVVDLKQDTPKFCGIARTNEEARAIAAAGKCGKELRKRTVQ